MRTVWMNWAARVLHGRRHCAQTARNGVASSLGWPRAYVGLWLSASLCLMAPALAQRPKEEGSPWQSEADDPAWVDREPEAEPPVGEVDSCELILELAGQRSGRTVQLRPRLRNRTHRMLSFLLESSCPGGPARILGLPSGYDPYESCRRGACLSPRPERVRLAPGQVHELAQASLSLDGDACNSPLPAGRYRLEFRVRFRSGQPRTCSGPLFGFDHPDLRWDRHQPTRQPPLPSPTGPRPAPPPRLPSPPHQAPVQPKKPVPPSPALPSPRGPERRVSPGPRPVLAPTPQRICPAKPACALACPHGMRRDTQGCTLCSCEPEPAVLHDGVR